MTTDEPEVQRPEETPAPVRSSPMVGELGLAERKAARAHRGETETERAVPDPERLERR